VGSCRRRVISAWYLVTASATLLPLSALGQSVVAPATERSGPSGGDIVGYDQIHHPVIGRAGMVVSQNETATRVGVEILRRGGNAVDASVAVGFAEAVTLPRAGNLGGGGVMLVHMAARADRPAVTVAIDYYGIAPHALTPALLLDSQGKLDRGKNWSFKGVAVPGTVAGLWAAHDRFGRLPWSAVVQPAIDLARQGVALSDDEAKATADQASAMVRDSGARAAFFKPDGSAYRPGEIFRQPDLAWTLTQIRDRGTDGFYRGPVAEKLVAAMAANGGIIDAADLAAYQVRVLEPVWSSYRGHRIAAMPPPASGVSVIEALNILETFPIDRMGWGSAANLHTLSETLKIVAADRRMVNEGQTSKSYGVDRAKLINPDVSLDAKKLVDGNPYLAESHNTTHFSVADAQGNVVSNTYTLSASYGAHVVAPGTGFLLNNSLQNFAWGERSNSFPATAPALSKRVSSTITPLIVYQGDMPWLVTGTPGGDTIIATMVQLLSNVIDHRLNIAEAAGRPRLNQGGGDAPLELERGFCPDAVALLEAKGHRIKPSLTMGSTQSIMIEGARFLGAADTRRPDALALGVDRAMDAGATDNSWQ
jgi:gamma-glutamyltranspeptidase / glutathione hydrolase